MSPSAVSNGHDAPGLTDQAVPSMAAMIDNLVVGFEYAVGEPVIRKTACLFPAARG